MAGALAVGGVVGLLLAGPDQVIPFGDLAGKVQVYETDGDAPAPTAASAVAPGLRSTTQLRPFGDLLDELALSPQANRQDSSESDDVGRTVPGRLPSDPMGPSRPVFLDEADGRPQITF